MSAISSICLHTTEIGSIDLSNSKTYKLKTHVYAYFLHFPNASWLRSFRLPWGLGGNSARIEHIKDIIHEAFKVVLKHTP